MSDRPEPRNVTPDHADQPSQAGQPEQPAQPDEFHRRFWRERDEGPEWAAWTWTRRGSGFPLIGVLLVLIGIALLVQFVFPQVGVGTMLLLAIGAAFLAGWVFGGSWFSMVPGVLLVALGVAELIEDVGLFMAPGQDVPGLASSALAIGFLAIWGFANAAGRRWNWPLWGAAIFGLIGAVQLSARIAVPELGIILPIVIIVVGVLLLLRARQR